MSAYPVVCSSTNHASRSGQPDWQASLGVADRQVAGMLCGACARLDPPDPTIANAETLRARATAAVAANAAFIAAGKPGTAAAQASAAYDQAVRLTKECNALIRLQFGLLDTIADTA